MKVSKRFASLSLAAVMVVSGISVGFAGGAVDANAASKATVYEITKVKDNDGGTTTYTYNKNGLIATKKTVTSTAWSDSDYVATDFESATTSENNTSTDTGSVTSETGTNTAKTVTKTVENGSSKQIETTKYSYYTKGKKKGKLKQETTTIKTTETNNRNKTVNGVTDTAYTGSYTASKTATSTTKYTYNKKGVLKSAVTTTEVPTYDTYSDLTGYYATKATDTDSEYANGSDYTKDKITTTSTTKYTVKKGKISKASTKLVIVKYDYDEYTSSSGSYTEVDEYTTTKSYDAAAATYTYKNGLVVKEKISDPNTGTYESKHVSTTTYTDGTKPDVYTSTNTRPIDYGKDTTTVKYSYDKNKNLKKVVSNNAYNDITPTAYAWTETIVIASTNEAVTCDFTYETTIADKVALSGKTKGTTTYDVTVNEKTGAVKKAYVAVGKALESGEKNASTEVTKTTYSVKKKKVPSAYAEQAEAQQWAITNGGDLNSVLTQ